MVASNSPDSSRRRVVITGMGWITPLGDDIEAVWQRLLKGESGISPTELFDASTFPTTFSAQVKGFSLDKYLGADAERHRCGSRNTQFALAAAKMAWTDAGLDRFDGLDPTRAGIYLGGGEGPIDFFNFVEAAVRAWNREANGGRGDLDACKWAEVAGQKLDAVREFEQDPNMAAGHIACQFNVQGPTFNTLTACAASTQAIGEAANLIRRGDADVVISGGTHSMIHPFGVTGFNRLTALSTRNDSCITASRPFDRTRDGFVLGEGAGMLILEEYEHAVRRGARILAEVRGYGSTADAFRITDIHEDGRGGIAAMRLALEDAGLTPADIHYISAHGTGTEENDKIESLAIASVFGEHAKKVPISSVKSMFGHLIAAAGAVELITCVLAIRDGILPPTMNYSVPDPNCPLDYVPNQARKARVDAALSNSFGFGGQNDTLVVTRI
ncbi:MAG TPA: beta-ketoacyl-[acyl-carrier-protein] synthase family protein [Phycisphaerae bacterium]|nr:beta-ketoacyl-[acyl-carrier-protein] synthase family protein [Phycisphaerae bacterium]HOJ72585.1 beta-ketoacyl-[acyl-carrier-protein] synthase family protein [Phycisphaerae bacterium]HOM49754.1 beta-ketoacyl-[acyl-carrier-protein] synthase family protein [Phycisphaerae bacterium]HON64954.1 beta-ketoacyl-[acyl-carrier-protein] synthase family protein [Phycisphaerae bacterium]HOQ84801.1 beta-ketoacyl-[acyl-carrier-protein] synthase family protein [Phycisphaerae bacterium]